MLLVPFAIILLAGKFVNPAPLPLNTPVLDVMFPPDVKLSVTKTLLANRILPLA
jgi:hypothetical protein